MTETRMVLVVGCSVDGCVRGALSRGLCAMHYGRLNRTGSLDRKPLQSALKCSEEGCEKVGYSRGLCEMHYGRRRREQYRAQNPGAFRVHARKWPERCAAEGCDRTTRRNGAARGYCHRHWRQWRRFGEVKTGDRWKINADRLATEPCLWAGCKARMSKALVATLPVQACSTHRAMVLAGQMGPRETLTVESWMARYARQDGECLIWTGSPSMRYAVGRPPGDTKMLNLGTWVWERAGRDRVSYHLTRTCGNDRCIRLEHLKPKIPKPENWRPSKRFPKTQEIQSKMASNPNLQRLIRALHDEDRPGTENAILALLGPLWFGRVQIAPDEDLFGFAARLIGLYRRTGELRSPCGSANWCWSAGRLGWAEALSLERKRRDQGKSGSGAVPEEIAALGASVRLMDKARPDESPVDLSGLGGRRRDLSKDMAGSGA